jgi:hypothetical protein
MGLDVKILPFVPTKEEIAMALKENAEPVQVDGAILGQVSIRRTTGPVELFIQSAPIEEYFQRLSATFYGEPHIETYPGGAPKKLAIEQLYADDTPRGGLAKIAPTGNEGPFAGKQYYRVPMPAENFYDVSGRSMYSMKAFGYFNSPPGMPGDKHNRDISLLAAVGLGAGVTFKYPMVISEHGMTDILYAVKEGLVTFYANFMKPITHNVIIAIRHEAPKVKATIEVPEPARNAAEMIPDPLGAAQHDEMVRILREAGQQARVDVEAPQWRPPQPARTPRTPRR